MTPRGRFRFWSVWLIGGLAAVLLWYEPLLNSFWGSLAGIFIFGFFVSLPLAWLLTAVSKKTWAADRHKAAWLIGGLALFFFIFYSAFSLHKHNNFFTGYDLAIFDQAVWHLSRFEIPKSSIRGVPSVFGDHFDPILIFLAPVYGLFGDTRVLLVVQAFLLVLGAAVIFGWSKKEKIAPFWAILLVFLYLTHPGIQGAANCDFHEIAFAPFLLLAVFYFLSQKAWRGFFVSLALLLAVKEEFALWAVAIGIYVLIKEKNRRVGAIAIALGAVYFLLVMKVFMPALNYESVGYAYGELFPGFENGFWAGVGYYAQNPSGLIQILMRTPEKWWSIMLYTVPLAVPLLFNPAGIALLAAPVATRVLSSYKYLSYAGLYYNAVFAALTVVIFMFFLKKGEPTPLRNWIEAVFSKINVSFPIWTITLAVSINMFFSYGYSYLLDWGYNWRSVENPRRAQLDELVAQIPPEASVSASYFVLPHLSQRPKLYVIPRVSDAEYVILDYCEGQACNYWPVGSKNIPPIKDFLVQNPLYRIKSENSAGVIFERTGEIDEGQKSNLEAFCRQIIGQSELEPVHRTYLSANCAR